jgi:hypothetical protein
MQRERRDYLLALQLVRALVEQGNDQAQVFHGQIRSWRWARLFRGREIAPKAA